MERGNQRGRGINPKKLMQTKLDQLEKGEETGNWRVGNKICYHGVDPGGGGGDVVELG